MKEPDVMFQITNISCRFSLTILLLLCFAGCGSDRPIVVLENVSWPDGSVVSIIQDGRIVDRSTLYGDHVMLRAAGPGICRIRAGERNALSWISGKVLLSEGINRIYLSTPSIRRRTGRGMFGLSLGTQEVDLPHALLFDNPVPGVTTLTVEYEAFSTPEELLKLAATAHANAVECIVSLQLAALPEGRKSNRQFSAMLDKMEMSGIDGVLLDPDIDTYSLDIFPQFVRTAATEIHLRGMTLTVLIPESQPGNANPAVFFRDIPSPETPDMIRIAAPTPSETNPSPDTVLQIERAADRMVRDGVPLARISAELALSATAFTPRQGGGYDHAPLDAGDLESILPVAGMDAVLRLRDGTLRLGFRGRVYSFEDVEGLTWKVKRLGESPLAPKGGVHIMYDGMGITLDRSDLKRLTEAYIVR